MSYNNLQKGRYSQHNQIYFITTVLHQRKPIFKDFFCAKNVVLQIKTLHDDGLVDSLAWVIMPDHVHWLFALNDITSLPKTMQRFKARTAHQINRYLDRRGTVWQKAYYDHALRREEDIKGTARYIIANPLRAGIVNHIGDYPLWDAIWL